MKLKRRVVVVSLVVVALPIVCSVALYVGALYQRWCAEQLFAAVRNLRPGITTEAEYMNAVRPFENACMEDYDGDSGKPIPGALIILSEPAWFWRVMHLSVPLRDFIYDWPGMRGTAFDIHPEFVDGKLSLLKLIEEQGGGHPLGGFVTIHAGHLKHLYSGDLDEFTGYAAQPLRIGGSTRLINSIVDIDDRATEEERRRALDFRFVCFTAFDPCTDGRRFLDPVTTRP